jgi:hypothetical protein
MRRCFGVSRTGNSQRPSGGVPTPPLDDCRVLNLRI